MENVLRVRLTVRKYTWDEFVHDVLWLLVFIALFVNKFCWRYLNMSLKQLLRLMLRTLKYVFCFFVIAVWSGLLIDGFIKAFQ